MGSSMGRIPNNGSPKSMDILLLTLMILGCNTKYIPLAKVMIHKMTDM